MPEEEQSFMRMMDNHEKMMEAHRHMWSTRGFDDFFSEPFAPSRAIIPSLITNNEKSIMKRSSPHYEITEDENKFQIAVDVPGMKKDNLSVQLEHGGRVLKLAGNRSVKKGNSMLDTKFEKQICISRNVDASKISADLADGVLVITAPKKASVDEDVKLIEIAEGSQLSRL
eukprot:CAMPEP_0172485180 /NCGR_PEP_ID=MMETSP1066-20121228/13055_1 /TAXON_ID=671091 /ORGANISM="Coscinodiscus wailesii, Strain CCMP2513" /LENGTH=170 /DNA_ID=CAMNT_0013250219 /DNA_START=116 /DNA_END=628 /DNA_ORIENTATION=+